MKFPDWLPVFGDTSYRGKCPVEDDVQYRAIGHVRNKFPDTLGKLVLHPKNENSTDWDRLRGMAKGAADIIICGCPTFVCELKRADHTKCKWEKDQLDFLLLSQQMGCFTCVALGLEGFKEALQQYINKNYEFFV